MSVWKHLSLAGILTVIVRQEPAPFAHRCLCLR